MACEELCAGDGLSEATAARQHTLQPAAGISRTARPADCGARRIEIVGRASVPGNSFHHKVSVDTAGFGAHEAVFRH